MDGLPTVPVTAKNTTAGDATCYGSEGEEPLIGHETISEVPGTYVKGKSIRKFFGVPDLPAETIDHDSSEEEVKSPETGYHIGTVEETNFDFAPASPLTGIPVYQIDREMSPMFTGDSDWEERSPMFGLGRSRNPIFPKTSIFASKDETLQTEYVSEYSADHIRQMWSSQVPAPVPPELDEGDLTELSDQFSFSYGLWSASPGAYPEDPAEAEDNDD